MTGPSGRAWPPGVARPTAGATPQITELLTRARGGDTAATDQLASLLYAELRRLARSLMARERPGATLQPTALVHEAYLRLLGAGPGEWLNRAHFMGAAAVSMRRILVERARRRPRQKRGGGQERVTLHESTRQYELRPAELLALDDALAELRRSTRRWRRSSSCAISADSPWRRSPRCWASVRTVHRHWAAARAWLHRALDRRRRRGGPTPRGSGA